MAQGYIDGFYESYPEVQDFVYMCKGAVHTPGYLETPFGRRRRFTTASRDRAVLAAQEREAVNFPIQGVVAELFQQAVINLLEYRELFPVMFKLLLGIHDASLCEVPVKYVPVFVDEVLPLCMCTNAVCPSWQPTRDSAPTKPFSLSIDISIGTRWGAPATTEELAALGVDKAWLEAREQKKGKK